VDLKAQRLAGGRIVVAKDTRDLSALVCRQRCQHLVLEFRDKLAILLDPVLR
jgi:hypothetical protein